MTIRNIAIAAAAGALALGGLEARADTVVIDLTHPLGTFEALDGDINQPDLSKPHFDSIALPTFGKQAVFHVVDPFATNQGQFYRGIFVYMEHHGTHMDSPGHYVTDDANTESSSPDRSLQHQISAGQLVGPAVVIDIGSRVQAELDKNGGKPSPDTAVTDFSDDSPNVVTADDISAVAGQLTDGAWIVLNLGWARFYYDANWDTTPYFNGFNFPGLSRSGVDRLIEIEDAKGIRIAGIIADNIGVDTGESSRGAEDWSNSWHSHVRGLQRGWKLVENVTNLDQVAMAGDCTIVVGVLNYVAGGGGPARVMAMCDK